MADSGTFGQGKRFYEVSALNKESPLAQAAGGDRICRRSIAGFPVKGTVVFNPILYIQGGEIIGRVADYHSGNTGVDDQTFAHGAGVGVGHQPAVCGFNSHQIQGGADHFAAGSVDNGVGFGVDRPAKLISLPAGNIHLFPQAVAEIAVQINGKMRGTIKIAKDADKETAIAAAKEAVADKLTGNIVKEIYVPGRIVNIVQK